MTVAANHPPKYSATGVDRLTPLPGSLRVLDVTTKTILIVDDEPFICDVAARVLSKAGYETRTANGGRAAIEQLRRDPMAVQLVLLDLLMPDLDGWATLAALRQLRGNLTVVLTGGQAEEEILAQGGMDKVCCIWRSRMRLDTLVAVVERAALHAE